MSKYLVIIEKGRRSFGAYVPDLPGCVAVGRTAAEVRQLIHEAILLHIQVMREHGDPVPRPSSRAEYVEPTAA